MNTQEYLKMTSEQKAFFLLKIFVEKSENNPSIEATMAKELLKEKKV